MKCSFSDCLNEETIKIVLDVQFNAETVAKDVVIYACSYHWGWLNDRCDNFSVIPLGGSWTATLNN